MPPATTKEHQLARDRKRAKAYRDRHPERARAARRKSDAKRRANPNYKPRVNTTPCPKPEEVKRQVRANMIRARMEYLKAKIAPTP